MQEYLYISFIYTMQEHYNGSFLALKSKKIIVKEGSGKD